MVKGNAPKNLEELYKFYNKNNPFFPTLTVPPFLTSPPPKVYLNPSILLLCKIFDISLFGALESIQEGDLIGIPSTMIDGSADAYNNVYDRFNVYFNMDKAAGSCAATTKVFKKISKGLNNINEPINQFLNQDSLYDFRNISSFLDRPKLPIEHGYYLYETLGGWSYSPGIFILKYGQEQPSFLNWREPPF